MAFNSPPQTASVKTIITKKSATKIFLERFWADDVIKFSGNYLEMPDALDDKDVGTKITQRNMKQANMIEMEQPFGIGQMEISGKNILM